MPLSAPTFEILPTPPATATRRIDGTTVIRLPAVRLTARAFPEIGADAQTTMPFEFTASAGLTPQQMWTDIVRPALQQATRDFDALHAVLPPVDISSRLPSGPQNVT